MNSFKLDFLNLKEISLPNFNRYIEPHITSLPKKIKDYVEALNKYDEKFTATAVELNRLIKQYEEFNIPVHEKNNLITNINKRYIECQRICQRKILITRAAKYTVSEAIEHLQLYSLKFEETKEKTLEFTKMSQHENKNWIQRQLNKLKYMAKDQEKCKQYEGNEKQNSKLVGNHLSNITSKNSGIYKKKDVSGKVDRNVEGGNVKRLHFRKKLIGRRALIDTIIEDSEGEACEQEKQGASVASVHANAKSESQLRRTNHYLLKQSQREEAINLETSVSKKSTKLASNNTNSGTVNSILSNNGRHNSFEISTECRETVSTTKNTEAQSASTMISNSFERELQLTKNILNTIQESDNRSFSTLGLLSTTTSTTEFPSKVVSKQNFNTSWNNSCSSGTSSKNLDKSKDATPVTKVTPPRFARRNRDIRRPARNLRKSVDTVKSSAKSPFRPLAGNSTAVFVKKLDRSRKNHQVLLKIRNLFKTLNYDNNSNSNSLPKYAKKSSKLDNEMDIDAVQTNQMQTPNDHLSVNQKSDNEQLKEISEKSSLSTPNIPSSLKYMETRNTLTSDTVIYKAEKRNLRTRLYVQEATLLDEDLNEPKYCICNEISYGDMIGCDNEDCPREWFHFSCVGITKVPEGEWYCYECSVKNKKRRHL